MRSAITQHTTLLSTLIVTYLVAFFTLGPAYAKPVQPGTKAKNLKILPAWTMKLCGDKVGTPAATYDEAGALKLKKKDNDCWLWYQTHTAYGTLRTEYKSVISKLNKVVLSYENTRKLDQERIQSLTKQLMTEIAEKNKYKYKPNYLWIVVAGGAVVVAAIVGGVIGWKITDAKK